MFNLSQRLILGCVVLFGLTLGLVAATHRALAAAGQARLGYVVVLAALLFASGTIYLVLWPIHKMARDAKKIARGNLEHRVEWSSRDDFGVIASELNRHCGAAARAARHRSRPAADGVSALRCGAAIDLRAHHRDRRQGPRAEGEPGRSRAAGRSRRRTAWR